MPTIFALTGDFAVQNPTGTIKPIARKNSHPQLRSSSGRLALTGADGYRVDLFNVNGRRINAGADGASVGGTLDLGRHSSGIVICRIIGNKNGLENGSITKVVPLQNGVNSVK
jgi:hypothetical protein